MSAPGSFEEARWIGGASLPSAAERLGGMLRLAVTPNAGARLRAISAHATRIGGPTTDFISLSKLLDAAHSAEPSSELLGRLDTLLVDRLIELARAVGMIVLSHGEPATGFLIEKDRLLTNHHVLPNRGAAAGAELVLGFDAPAAAPSIVKLDPDTFFKTDPELDATIIAVHGAPGLSWGVVPLAPGQPVVGEPAFIIQHPRGGPKQVAVRDNEIRGVTDAIVQYYTDTARGSSGSPVFDRRLKLIALHAEGSELAVRGPGGVNYFKNQGTRIERINASTKLY